MRKSRWPMRRSPRWCVAGLDVGPEGVNLVVLVGSALATESVCCAERLVLPDGLVMNGDIVQAQALGHWLKAWLKARDHLVQGLYVAVADAEVKRGALRLPASLPPTDVAFQISAELQATSDIEPLCWDYIVDHTKEDNPAESAADTQSYIWATVPRARLDAWQQLALAAGLPLKAVMPRGDAVAHTEVSTLTASWVLANAGVALQYDVAFGLALGAWHHTGFNFLPHRALKLQALRRRWWQRMAISAATGLALAGGAAIWFLQMADLVRGSTGDIVAAEQALKQARGAQRDAQLALTDVTAQGQWLQGQARMQQHTLQWSRVLAQHSQGLWVSEVTQQQARWVAKGEALSSAQAQHLVQQLKGLDVWAQSPELRHLELTPATSPVALPVWHFRIEADLKVGV